MKTKSTNRKAPVLVRGGIRLACFLALLFLASCAGNPGTIYRASLDSTRTGVRLEIQDWGDSETVTLTSPFLGSGVKILGTLEPVQEDGSRKIALDSLQVFQNWAQGWTQGEWALTGEARLLKAGDSWSLEVREAPEILEVRTAALRYKDRFLRDDQAQKYLRDRWERIKAGAQLVSGKWYRSPRGEWNWLPPGWTAQFEELAGKVLFPELYGPEGSPLNGKEKSDGEGLSWDKEYTAGTFPPELHEIRNTGTLYRDWEEGLGLWFLAAQWKPFWEQKIPAAVFHLP